MLRIFLIAFYLTSLSTLSVAQFTSVQDGNWNDGATWGNASPGIVGIDFPGTGDDVTIALGHNIIVPNGFDAEANNIGFGGLATGSDLTVADGGSLSFTGTFTVGTGPATRGRVFVNGRLIVEDGATFAGGITSIGRLTIGATGIYQHNYSTSSGQIYT